MLGCIFFPVAVGGDGAGLSGTFEVLVIGHVNGEPGTLGGGRHSAPGTGVTVSLSRGTVTPIVATGPGPVGTGDPAGTLGTGVGSDVRLGNL